MSGGGGNLYVFDTPVKLSVVRVDPASSVVVYGRWNSDHSAYDDFDFVLRAGEVEYSPSHVRVSRVALSDNGNPMPGVWGQVIGYN